MVEDKKIKNKKGSLAEKIIKILNKTPKSAEEIRKEIKDDFGYREKLKDIRVNLLYLLRRGKIKRAKEKNIYRYHI